MSANSSAAPNPCCPTPHGGEGSGWPSALTPWAVGPSGSADPHIPETALWGRGEAAGLRAPQAAPGWCPGQR